MEFVYVVYEYDKKAGTLSRTLDITDCDPLTVKEQFNIEAAEEPYIFDAFPIISGVQATTLSKSLEQWGLDFEHYDYMLEANST